ncbi:SMP-30/gluconolactonase/LRE family protein [Streptomyces sp. NA04227]|nr:SMP-30/gluconolactonase/LRE family protein [Streptomyces sp. NA04227]
MHFVDLLAGRLWRCARRPGEPPALLLDLGIPLGAAAPVRGCADEWIVAAGDGIALAGPRGEPYWLARPEADAPVPMRMNDAVCDPLGRFWATSMSADGRGAAGSLYRVGYDGAVQRMLMGLTVPNGPAFSPDGRVMYLADSAERTILRFGVDPVAGTLRGGSLFACLAPHEGRPDGMTVDDLGRLWVALWGAGQVRCYAPDGSVAGSLSLPTPHTSSVAFADGRIWVSTATHRLADPDPLAGAVLARETRVTAPAAACFGAPSVPSSAPGPRAA